MFTETLIAAFALGTIIGGAYVWAMCFRPLERQMRNLEYQNFRAERQRAYRAEHRRQHLGTPYISQTGNATARTFEFLVDDHNGSRKALEVVR